MVPSNHPRQTFPPTLEAERARATSLRELHGGPLFTLTAETGSGRRGSLGRGAGQPNQRGMDRVLPVGVPSLTVARFSCGCLCPMGPPGRCWPGLASREGPVHSSLGEPRTTLYVDHVPVPLEEIPCPALGSPIPSLLRTPHSTLAALDEGRSGASWGRKAGKGTLLCGAGWDRGWQWSK